MSVSPFYGCAPLFYGIISDLPITGSGKIPALHAKVLIKKPLYVEREE
jgi:hypothetical protein